MQESDELPVGTRVEVRCDEEWKPGTVVRSDFLRAWQFPEGMAIPYLVKPDDGSTMMMAQANGIRRQKLPLDKLAPDVLIAIAEILAADERILKPRHLGSLARSCKVINEAVQDAINELELEYDGAEALVELCGDSVERLVEQRPTALRWGCRRLTAADAPKLTNVLKSKALAQVEWLQLDSNSLGDEGAAAIVAAGAAGCLPRLKGLDLDYNEIGAAGVTALASAFAGGAFRKLVYLNLGRNPIGDAGVTAIAASLEKRALPKLEKLHLNESEIGDEGLKALMAAAVGGGLAKLQILNVKDNQLSEEAIEALAEAIENGKLVRMVWGELVMNMELINARLRAACEEHGVRPSPYETPRRSSCSSSFE